MPWSSPFDEPIKPPKGKPLLTLQDAADYIMRLPKAEALPECSGEPGRPKSSTPSEVINFNKRIGGRYHGVSSSHLTVFK